LSDEQRNRLKSLLKVQQHHSITAEIRRELFGMASATSAAKKPAFKTADDMMSDDE